MIHTNYGILFFFLTNSCIFKLLYDRRRSQNWWNGNTGTSHMRIHAGVQELSQSEPSLTAMLNRCPQICLHYHGHTDTHTRGYTYDHGHTMKSYSCFIHLAGCLSILKAFQKGNPTTCMKWDWNDFMCISTFGHEWAFLAHIQMSSALQRLHECFI